MDTYSIETESLGGVVGLEGGFGLVIVCRILSVDVLRGRKVQYADGGVFLEVKIGIPRHPDSAGLVVGRQEHRTAG